MDWTDVLREHFRELQDVQGSIDELSEERKNEIRGRSLDNYEVFEKATSMTPHDEDVRGRFEDGEKAVLIIEDEIDINDIMRAIQHLNTEFDETDIEIVEHATDVGGYGGHIPSG